VYISKSILGKINQNYDNAAVPHVKIKHYVPNSKV